MEDEAIAQLQVAEQAIAQAWELGGEFEKAALWIVHGVVVDLLAGHQQQVPIDGSDLGRVARGGLQARPKI